jgi:SAM-dependent methyltransferase
MDQHNQPDSPNKRRTEAELNGAYWEERYAQGEDEWDKGAPSPGLVDFLQGDNPETGRVLVPGCGRGHDVRAWARAGFDATGLDVTLAAVRDAAEIAGREGLTNAKFVQGDFFQPPSAWRGGFDWMFEHTFFCAIHPTLRDRYVEQMAGYLRDGGHLLGVFYMIPPEEEGPPFGTTREELLRRFGGRFELVRERVPRSYPNRTGMELLMLWRKRPVN